MGGRIKLPPMIPIWSFPLIYSPPETEEIELDLKPKKRDPDGCFCVDCKEFSPYSEPNLSNDQFRCYSCRTYPRLTKVK
jgi:hypothetical protein